MLWKINYAELVYANPANSAVSSSKQINQSLGGLIVWPYYGRTLSDASMLYFTDVFYIFYARLSWPNG